jgi:hypothetical protein
VSRLVGSEMCIRDRIYTFQKRSIEYNVAGTLFS